MFYHITKAAFELIEESVNYRDMNKVRVTKNKQCNIHVQSCLTL